MVQNGNTKQPPLLLPAGTIIVSGHGRGVVIGTGDNTMMGQIAGLASGTARKESLISRDVKRFITLISAVAITMGVVYVIVAVVLGTHSPTQARQAHSYECFLT